MKFEGLFDQNLQSSNRFFKSLRLRVKLQLLFLIYSECYKLSRELIFEMLEVYFTLYYKLNYFVSQFNDELDQFRFIGKRLRLLDKKLELVDLEY